MDGAALRAVLSCAGLLALACSHKLPDTCARNGPLKLVPVGVSQAVPLDEWAKAYAARHEVELSVATPMDVPGTALDAEREQYAAEAVIAAIDAHRRKGSETLIGVMASDLFIQGRPEWKWGFGTWGDATGIISTARMHGDDRVAQRLAAMFGRYVGMLYCGLPRKGPPHSTLREKAILSAADLDEIDSDVW